MHDLSYRNDVFRWFLGVHTIKQLQRGYSGHLFCRRCERMHALCIGKLRACCGSDLVHEL